MTENRPPSSDEFGHILGLDDAYADLKERNRPDAADADADDNDIMRSHYNGIYVGPKDIQMVFYAWANNEVQYYQSYEYFGTNERSEALDRVN